MRTEYEKKAHFLPLVRLADMWGDIVQKQYKKMFTEKR